MRSLPVPSALRLLTGALLAALVAGVLGVAGATTSAAAAPRGGGSGSDVVSRGVVFDVGNTSDSLLACQADGRRYRLHARLVGPRRVVSGHAGPRTFNVLVHDAGTGGWFWDLRSRPSYDYARRLAGQGQVSVVLDRLGYDASPLGNGNKTCMDAQVQMLHTVVQRLYSATYSFAHGRHRNATPQAAHVVVQGHGAGATIAQAEAVRYSDTGGLVLMSPLTTSPTRLALQTLRDQGRTCLGRRTFAPFGSTARDFRRLLFASAPAAVRRDATRRRNSTPCGDVATLPATVGSQLLQGKVDVPVLVLRGSRDTRSTGRLAVGSSKHVSRRTIKGAGSALVLERQAPRVRRVVVRWLRGL